MGYHFVVPRYSLCNLVLILERKNLLNKFLLPFQCLLCRLFKLFHVLTNSLKFFFNTLQVFLSKFSSFKTSLKFSFLNTKFPGQFIQFLFIIKCHLDSSSKIFIEFLNSNFIIQASIFNNFDSFKNIISRFGSKSQFCDSIAESISRFLVFFLHQHDPTGKSCNITFNFLELLISFFKRLGSLCELVVGFIITNFKLLYFLSIITDVTVSLISSACSFLGGFLKSTDGCIETFSLCFKRLHLLANGVHLDSLLLELVKVFESISPC